MEVRSVRDYNSLAILPRLDFVYGGLNYDWFCWITVGWLFWGVSFVIKDLSFR